MDDPKIARCAVELRPKADLGTTRSGGLSGRHHFCFATYQRSDRLEWGALRAVNEYRLAAGAARGPTFHSGFEILTLVTSGRLRRLGTYTPTQALHAGSVELVSTSPGVQLGAETIGSEAATYLEIWIKAELRRREPRRDWRTSTPSGWDSPIASAPPVSARSLRLRANARIHSLSMDAGEKADRKLDEDECAYLVVRSGRLSGNGVAGGAGDGLAISGPGLLSIQAHGPSTILLIRTPKLG